MERPAEPSSASQLAEDDPIICVCRSVSEDEICRAIDNGASTLALVRQACGANTECGSCAEDIEELLAER